MGDAIFHDIHCHALTLAHPGFLSFLELLRRRGLESVYSQVAAPGFLVPALLSRSGHHLRNLLSVMENDVGSIFMLMEDDLRGLYGGSGEGKEEDEPPLRADGLHVGGELYQGLSLSPLVMDFSGERAGRIDAHFDRPPRKPVGAQIRDLLEGIADYRAARPEGFLRFRPFLGLDPANYDESSLLALLESGFGGYVRGSSRGDFSGVKVYPPLGFDPWPDGAAERAKTELLYGFCESRGIPLVTHCNDQGFRTLSLHRSWELTAPARWAGALARHPRLILDFAHFGERYTRAVGSHDPGDWTRDIADLMLEHPGVHADLAYDIAEPDCLPRLEAFLLRLDPRQAERVLDRLMFGTDFPVCLARADSYVACYRALDRSGAPPDWPRRFGCVNPGRFLDGDCFA